MSKLKLLCITLGFALLPHFLAKASEPEKCGSQYTGREVKKILEVYAKHLKKQGFTVSYREDLKDKPPHLVGKLKVNKSKFMSAVDFQVTLDIGEKGRHNICGTTFSLIEPASINQLKQAEYLKTFNKKLKRASQRADKELSKK